MEEWKPSPEDKISIELDIASWNNILTAVKELPYKSAEPLIKEIMTQSSKAVQKLKEAAEKPQELS